MALAGLTVFYLVMPAVVLYFCYRFSALEKVGGVILCYIIGISLGNLFDLNAIFGAKLVPLRENLMTATVAISLPLLLFSIDVPNWLRLAGRTLLAMLLAMSAVVIATFIACLYANNLLDEVWKLAGLAIGVYTGGTPNMAAVKSALDVDSTVFVTMHTYDALVSAAYILFVTSIAQRVFLHFLPAFRSQAETEQGANENAASAESLDSYVGIFKWSILRPLAVALALALGVVVAAGAVASFFPESQSMTAAIVTITTLGIACSFVKPIRNIEKSFQLGMYIILVFCIVVGSMVSSDLVTTINYEILNFIIIVVFGAVFIHALLCRAFNIDTDTFLITSVSSICSPPFIGVAATALKNKEIILSGLTTGVLGYALGNYLGVSMAYLFQQIL